MPFTLDQNLITFLLNQPLMHGLDETDLQALLPYLKVFSFGPGETIFSEGDLSNDLYVVFEGEVSLIKRAHDKKSTYSIGTLAQGQVVGEMSFIDDSPRSCGVVTERNLTLIQLARKQMQELPPNLQGIYEKIVRNLAKLTIRRVRDANEFFSKARENEIQKFQLHTDYMRLFLNVLLATIVVSCISGWIYLCSIDTGSWLSNTRNFQHLSNIIQNGFFLVNWMAIGVILPWCIRFIRKQRMGLKMFGISLENRGKMMANIFAAVSLLVILAAVAILAARSMLAGLFKSSLDWNSPYFLPVIAGLLLYPVYVLACEFILRGVMQTLLQKSRLNISPWYGAVYVAALAAACNAFFGLATVCLVFMLHLVCGWIYAKEKAIFLPATVHLLLALGLKYMGLLPFANLT